MVDLSIAASFARDLTEEQFAERPRATRRASQSPAGRGSAERVQARAAKRPLGRALAHLVQVRG
jgi:hypothetical protein